MKLILSANDRTVGVQGYAGSGKTTMLRRARGLLEKKGYEVRGLAPSASAARTLDSEAGIGSETLQRFLARYAGVAEGRMTRKGEKEMRSHFARTALVVDEGSLASTVQARNVLRIADALGIPRVVLVGDAKQLDAVDAGKQFAQLQKAGMPTAVMDEIMRQRDPGAEGGGRGEGAAHEAKRLAGSVRWGLHALRGANLVMHARWLRHAVPVPAVVLGAWYGAEHGSNGARLLAGVRGGRFARLVQEYRDTICLPFPVLAKLGRAVLPPRTAPLDLRSQSLYRPLSVQNGCWKRFSETTSSS